MPAIKQNVDNGLGVILTYSGTITDNEWADFIKKHLTENDEHLIKYKYSLSDLTAVTQLDISTETIERVSQYFVTASKLNPDAIVAVVANKPLTFGMARMAEALRYETTWEEMVFRSRKEAEDWLKKRVKEKYGIDDLTFG